MKADASPDTLVPAALIPEIQAAAAEEQREPGDLVDEAVRRYLFERRSYRRDEVHRKIARGLQSLREGKARDGEALMAELLAEIETLPPAR